MPKGRKKTLPVPKEKRGEEEMAFSTSRERGEASCSILTEGGKGEKRSFCAGEGKQHDKKGSTVFGRIRGRELYMTDRGVKKKITYLRKEESLALDEKEGKNRRTV